MIDWLTVSVFIFLAVRTDHAHILQRCGHRDDWSGGSRRRRGFSDGILRGGVRLRRRGCFRRYEVHLHSSGDELFFKNPSDETRARLQREIFTEWSDFNKRV